MIWIVFIYWWFFGSIVIVKMVSAKHGIFKRPKNCLKHYLWTHLHELKNANVILFRFWMFFIHLFRGFANDEQRCKPIQNPKDTTNGWNTNRCSNKESVLASCMRLGVLLFMVYLPLVMGTYCEKKNAFWRLTLMIYQFAHVEPHDLTHWALWSTALSLMIYLFNPFCKNRRFWEKLGRS